VRAGAPAPAAALLQVDQLIPLGRAANRRKPEAGFAPVSFTQAAGERLAIVGPAGEVSALARAIALIDKPASGQVRLGGDDLTRAWGGRLRTLRRALQYVGGEGRRALPPYASVQAILTEPLQVHGLGRPEERRLQVAAAAAAWQVNGGLLAGRVSSLSSAMCQRVALARVSLLGPRVLVCDRLTDRLEPAAVQPLLDLLAGYCDRTGVACLLITTDPALAAGFATRTLRLDPAGLHPA
jgi:peptide/nickel transport system ATP-binding protein